MPKGRPVDETMPAQRDNPKMDDHKLDDQELDDQELGDEVLELTLLWQQGQSNDEELARLERLLADSDRARRAYIAVADDTATLAETALVSENTSVGMAGGIREPVGAERALSEAAPGGDRASHPFQVGSWSRLLTRPISFPRLSLRAVTTRKVVTLTIAASLLVGLTVVGIHSLARRDESARVASKEPPARIVSLSGVKWSPGKKEYTDWSRVSAGESLQFESGMVELVIDNSVQLVLEGPADFQLVSRRRAIVRQGKLVARVGPEAIGFSIETPHADVIDRGTSFGISISPDEGTDVVVYEGMVDLSVRQQADRRGRLRLLTKGEALRVGSHGEFNRIAAVERNSFLPPPKLGSISIKRPQIIRSVVDNVSLNESAKFHWIVGGGMTEDCPAYVDRLHEWNGVDSRGIPPFLATADYVMGFNDDKVLANLQISVGLSQPASLYILWDDRVDVPRWVRDQFFDTGWDIGLDEGFDDVGEPNLRRIGSGAGQSIDQIFSIWRRDVPEAGNVLLGPVVREETSLHPRLVPSSMYGIAATPLVPQRPLDSK